LIGRGRALRVQPAYMELIWIIFSEIESLQADHNKLSIESRRGKRCRTISTKISLLPLAMRFHLHNLFGIIKTSTTSLLK
jgi:hypothetical protein